MPKRGEAFNEARYSEMVPRLVNNLCVLTWGKIDGFVFVLFNFKSLAGTEFTEKKMSVVSARDKFQYLASFTKPSLLIEFIYKL